MLFFPTYLHGLLFCCWNALFSTSQSKFQYSKLCETYLLFFSLYFFLSFLLKKLLILCSLSINLAISKNSFGHFFIILSDFSIDHKLILPLSKYAFYHFQIFSLNSVRSKVQSNVQVKLKKFDLCGNHDRHRRQMLLFNLSVIVQVQLDRLVLCENHDKHDRQMLAFDL